MLEKKYKNFLNIILIIVVLAIIGVGTYIFYEYVYLKRILHGNILVITKMLILMI